MHMHSTYPVYMLCCMLYVCYLLLYFLHTAGVSLFTIHHSYYSYFILHTPILILMMNFMPSSFIISSFILSCSIADRRSQFRFRLQTSVPLPSAAHCIRNHASECNGGGAPLDAALPVTMQSIKITSPDKEKPHAIIK